MPQFFFVEADDLQFPSSPKSDVRKPGTFAHDELYEDLVEDFATLPQSPKKRNYDNYGVVNVSPSVVPNPYLPSFRIFSYNVTQAERAEELREENLKKKKKKKDRKPGHNHGADQREKLCKEAEYQESWRCQLREPWHSDAAAPSRRNTLWTPLGYAQVRPGLSRYHENVRLNVSK